MVVTGKRGSFWRHDRAEGSFGSVRALSWRAALRLSRTFLRSGSGSEVARIPKKGIA